MQTSRRLRAWPVVLALALSAPQAALARPAHWPDTHVVAYHVKTTLSLAGYNDARAVAVGNAGQIAGDAGLNGRRRCILYNGSAIVDITPAGWPNCSVSAMTANGTLAGVVQSGDASRGFVYRANRAYVIESAATFSAVTDRARLIGTKTDGTSGVYDAVAGSWLRIADRATNCEMSLPLALNEHAVLGYDTCTGTPRLVLASAGRFVAIALPDGLVPAKFLTDANELLLYDPSTNGHAYFWPVQSMKAPLDLGIVPGDSFGAYAPLSANDHGIVVGENSGVFLKWVWSERDGMRDLEALLYPKSYFGLAVRDVDDAGNVLLQGFDFATGNQVWLMLEPQA